MLAVGGAELARSFGRSITFGPIYRDQPALAIDKVRFVGEPVAAVVAEDPDRAAEAASLVEVEYEPLPAVADLEAALADGAALVHEMEREAGTYGFAVGPVGTNVCSAFRLRKGSVEIGFAEAAFGSSVSVMTNVLPVNALAGFGTQETGWVLGFGLLGIDRELAFSTGVSVHLVQLAHVIAFGALGHLVMGFLRRAPAARGDRPPAPGRERLG